MNKASVVTLYLSSETIALCADLITPAPTLSAAITKYLNAIAAHIAPQITTLRLDNNPNTLDRKLVIILGADTHNLLLRATLSNPSLSLNAAVDILLRSFLPIIRAEFLIMGKNDLEALPEETYSHIKLQYGCLVCKQEKYWYWRYYVGHKPKDEYIKGSLDRVLAYVDRVGIPRRCRPKRLNKAKKIWELKSA